MDSAARVLVRSAWADRDEASLVRAVRSDPEAFGELCLRYSGRLYRYVRARSRSDEDAADLTQQVFVKAFEALPRYRDRGVPFGAWLFRIARNLLIDAHRREKDTISWDLLMDWELPAVNGDMDMVLVEQEASIRLHALLNDLPTDRRELIVLRFVAGLTLREIGAVLGKSEPTVHKQLKRTLRILQERYHDDD